MTSYAISIAFSDSLCDFGLVCALHSGHESCFVVSLVAFSKQQGLYQSAVTQSVSCLCAGLVLTMLMTGLLLNCEALWYYLRKVEWTLFSCSPHSSTFVQEHPGLAWVKWVITLPLKPVVSLRFWKMFDGKALEEILKEPWEKLFLAFGMMSC